MADFWTVLVTALLSLTAAYFAYWLVGKPRLLVFSPNSTHFELASPQNSGPPTVIRAGQIILQNTGRVSATDVQFVAEQGPLPWGYNIVPAVAHEVRTGSLGEWILELPFLGPGETVTLQILNGPQIATVRLDIPLKFPLQIGGLWHVTGVIDALPQDYAEMADELHTYGDRRLVSEAVTIIAQMVIPVVGMFGRPADAYGLNPVTIHRDVKL